MSVLRPASYGLLNGSALACSVTPSTTLDRLVRSFFSFGRGHQTDFRFAFDLDMRPIVEDVNSHSTGIPFFINKETV